MEIEFKKITDFPQGTLCSLLRDGYSFEPRFERDWLSQWKEFDDFFYDNPHIAEVSGFMTVYSGVPIGFVTWNPTNIPVSAEIGHNCIATKHKGKGYGKRQMQEAIKRITSQGAEKIIVTTNESLVPAQHTYKSAGFRFLRKTDEPNNAEYAGMRIHYEITVKQAADPILSGNGTMKKRRKCNDAS